MFRSRMPGSEEPETQQCSALTRKLRSKVCGAGTALSEKWVLFPLVSL